VYDVQGEDPKDDLSSAEVIGEEVSDGEPVPACVEATAEVSTVDP